MVRESDLKLRGKVAFVTGSSKGVGKAIACKLAEQGADIILHYFMDEKSCMDTKQYIEKKYNVNVMIVRGNLADISDINQIFKDIKREKEVIDILVNNAASGVHKSLYDMRNKDWMWTINVNGTGTQKCIQNAVAIMNEAGGYIVNISSMGSERYIPEYGAVASSKAILETLTKYYAIELSSKNIIVNTVVGGVMETEALDSFPSGKQLISEGLQKTPAGRLTTPLDIAKMVGFLVSGNADMLRGQKIIVDGGYSLL